MFYCFCSIKLFSQTIKIFVSKLIKIPISNFQTLKHNRLFLQNLFLNTKNYQNEKQISQNKLKFFVNFSFVLFFQQSNAKT